MRFSLLILPVTAISFGIGVFIMANHVQQAEKRINHLQAKIETEKENLRVLHAEWTFLNNPERLEKVARQHFQMVPSDGAQYIDIAGIPMRATLDAQQISEEEIKQLADISPGTPDDTALAEEKKPTPTKVNLQVKRVTGEGIGRVLPPPAVKGLPDIMVMNVSHTVTP